MVAPAGCVQIMERACTVLAWGLAESRGVRTMQDTMVIPSFKMMY